jgi:GT2 family glycosyltransferase
VKDQFFRLTPAFARSTSMYRNWESFRAQRANYRSQVLAPPSAETALQPGGTVLAPVVQPAAAAQDRVDFTAHGSGLPLVSIIIPVYGNQTDTVRCVRSIADDSASRTSYEILIADDAPHNRTSPALSGFSGLTVIENSENLGFLRNCNSAAQRANGKYILFLNNDTIVRPGWLDAMVTLAEGDASIGMVGCKLLNPDSTVQEAGGTIQRNGWGRPYGAGDAADKPEYNFVRDVDVVTGACFVVRGDAFRAVAGLDERYVPAFYEEFDLAFAMWEKGYRVVYQPAAEVVHLGSSTYGAEVRDRQSGINHAKFCEKWAARLRAQPDDAQPPVRSRSRNRLDAAPLLLMIDDKVPEFDRHAGALTVLQYLGLMRQLGWHVTYLPDDRIRSQPYTSKLQQMGVEVLYGDEDFVSWLARNGSELDLVWIARPAVALRWLSPLRKHTTARIFYYPHDIHFLREQRRHEVTGDPYALEESRRLREMEADVLNRVDCVLAPSADEVEVIRSLAPGVRIEVIQPYFYDASTLGGDYTASMQERRELIFVGGFGHLPNVDAAKWLVDEIMPIVWRSLPAQRLLIVGSSPPPEVLALAGPLVEVTGQVPNLEPYYARSIASVSPLRYGAGVKGKIVGSLQMGVPVITTDIGNEGLHLQHGVEALISSTAEQLADFIVRICTDDELRRSLSVNALAVVRGRFSAAVARERLQEVMGWRRCFVCGCHAERPNPKLAPAAEPRNWREEFACERCYALSRTNFLASVLLESPEFSPKTALSDCMPELSRLRIHEFGFVGAIHDQLREMPRFTCSDFFDDVSIGERTSTGVLCQDLQRLTFDAQSIDLAISQDVFEHVPDPIAGFREIYRVLRPGGRHLFTVPYSPALGQSRTRAKLGENGIEHLLPPEYHGDPIRGPQGALVFTDFGADLHSLLESIGFLVTVKETRLPGVGGGYVAVFDTTRPAVN